MPEKFRHIGEWWLPGQEDKKLPGVLSYDDDSSVSLELLGGFVFKDSEKHVVINGKTEKDDCTLLHLNTYNDSSHSFLCCSYMKIPIVEIHWGKHYKNISELKASIIYADINGISGWFRDTDCTFNDTEENIITNIPRKPKNILKIIHPDFCWSLYYKNKKLINRNVSDRRLILAVSCSTPSYIGTLLGYLYKTFNYLRLISDCTISINDLKIYDKDNKEVSIFGKFSSSEKGEEKFQEYPYELKDIQLLLDKLFTQYMNKYESIQPSIEAINTSTSYLWKFMNVITATESIAKRYKLDKYDKESLCEEMKIIYSNIGKKHKKFPPLSSLLIVMMNRAYPYLNETLSIRADRIEEIVEKSRNLRNDIAHERDSATGDYDIKEFAEFTAYWKVILEINIMLIISDGEFHPTPKYYSNKLAKALYQNETITSIHLHD